MERLLYALRNVNFSFVSTLVNVKPVGHKFLSLWPLNTLPQWIIADCLASEVNCLASEVKATFLLLVVGMASLCVVFYRISLDQTN